jgi:hypothetical protein
MVKFGQDFLKRENVVEKLSNFFDLSPSDIKGKHSFTDVVSNVATLYKHVHEGKIPEKVINSSEGVATIYQVIGYDLELSKKLEERKIKTKQLPVGTSCSAKDFNGDMVATHLPEIYTDEEGNIWKIKEKS